METAPYTYPHEGCAQKRVKVLVPFPFTDALEYLTPENMSLQAGDIVDVPLGRKVTTGVVWDTTSQLPPFLSYQGTSSPLPQEKLRRIKRKRKLPGFNKELRHFISWVSAYTFSAPGMVMAIALRPFIKGGTSVEAECKKWTLISAQRPKIRITPQRQRVIDALEQFGPLESTALAKHAQVGRNVIHGLADHHFIKSVNVEDPQKYQDGFAQLHYTPPHLTQAQKVAAQQLKDAIRDHNFKPILLEGVTGSGKTETYFEAIDTCLQSAKQVLVLLPEIALATQWKERFKKRFGSPPHIWHSSETTKNKRNTWLGVSHGTVPVVVGARSALFLPFKNLGCIIVDEEHEMLFKQEEGVLYNGRDMAIVRAKYARISVILATATPSLETLVNVRQGRYLHCILPQRHGRATLPDIETIDMRKAPPRKGEFLSPRLIEAVNEALTEDNQAMLFLNRRGYAPLTLCRKCGHRIECPFCYAWMVAHLSTQCFSCHYCDYTVPATTTCPHCHQEDALIPIGPGIERITQETRQHFPHARIFVMSSDSLKSPKIMEEAVYKITHKQIDVIIGTQVIAKGWHFPHLTRVGIVDADLGLSGADLRAGERTLQLLHQVAGRAGRAENPGKVLMQSFMPQHPVLQAISSGDIGAFLQEESRQRQIGHWPPWGRLAAIIISAPTEDVVQEISHHIAARAPHIAGTQILGPAPAPIAFLRGRHRRRILLRTQRHIAPQPILYRWLHPIQLSRSAQIRIDIDPVSFM